MTTPFSEWMGIQILPGDDGANEAFLTVDENHRNKRGVVHGGVVSALLDTALGAAVIDSMSESEWCGTISLSIQFVRPARGPRLHARGHLTGRGRRVAFARGELLDGSEQLVATAEGVWHIWPEHPDATRSFSSNQPS